MIWDRRTSVIYWRIYLPILLIVSDVFRRFFFISSHSDVDKRSFSKSGEWWGQIFFTFSITPTGKSPIIFSDWNLSKYSRDSMLSFSVLIYQSIILIFNYHCCKPSKFYFSYSILNFTSKMWKPPINVKLLFFLNNLEDFIKYI